MKENPEYLKSQRDVNKNLVDMLKKDEGKDVVLQENNGEAQRADDGDRTSDGKVSLKICVYHLGKMKTKTYV